MSAVPELQREPVRRLKRDEYDHMVELGWFENERVELLHGTVVQMAPEKAPHADAVDTLNEYLVSALAGRARVRIGHPILAADDSEPEPDVAVVAPGRHRAKHPDTAWLIVEVSRTSQHRDGVIKAPLYAASGFEEYWLVDLPAGIVEVYREPEDGRYRRMETKRPGDVLSPARFPEVVIPVDQLL